MAALVVLNLSRLKLSRTAIKKDDLKKLSTLTIYKNCFIKTIEIFFLRQTYEVTDSVSFLSKFIGTKIIANNGKNARNRKAPLID